MRDLDTELADQVRKRRFAGHPPEDLARLALLPQWTARLAARVGLAEPPDSDLVESISALRADGTEERVFWLRESVRPEVGAYLRAGHARTLEASLAGLEKQLAGDPAHDHWRTAAAAHRHSPSGIPLMRRVDALVTAGDVPEAARLVATAKALGEVVAGPLVGAARRAGWRLARAGREAEDAHYLRHYQDRPDLELEVARAGTWALHLLGPGGSGKTTLIRHPGQRTARVDFDHLDPRYPEDRPGEMFVALAVDLLGWVGDRRGQAAYERFLDAVDALHAGSGDPVLLERMVDGFAELMRALPEPVPLALDTCEELAKLYPPGEPAPGIDRTFELLELLHERLPELRVVLAGRRWLVPPPSGPLPAGPLLRARPYLRVIRVGGFSRAEAELYLERRGLDRGHEAVLARAESSDGYIPFDLAAYADWLLADPELDPAELLAAPGDPYIRQRVVGRIRDPEVVRCLGVAAELGTLDRALAGAVFAELGVDGGRVLAELAAQEWARVLDYTADGRPALVELEPNLRERLRAETATDPVRFPVPAAFIGQAAARAVDAAPVVSELTASTVLPAVRLLPEGEAVAVWQRIEDRVVAENAWGWAEQVAGRAAAVTSGTVLAAVMSTQAAVRIHTGGGGVAALWKHVERIGSPAQRDRALLGLIAAGDTAHVLELPRILRGAPPPGSVAAAADTLIEQGFGLVARTAIPYLMDTELREFALLQAAEMDLAAHQEVRVLPLPRPPRRPVAADYPPGGDTPRRAEIVRLLAAGDTPRRDPDLDWADTPEADRLHSLALVPMLDDPATVDIFAENDHYVPGTPRGWAARQVPALAVMLAEGYVAAGRYGRAAQVLRDRLEQALTAGDSGTVQDCQLALLRVCRRARDLSHYPAVEDLARNGSKLCRAEAWTTLRLVTGQVPASPDEVGSAYGWWRCTGEKVSLGDGGIPEPLQREAAREQAFAAGSQDSLEPELPYLATRFRWLRGARTLDYAEVAALNLRGAAVPLLERAAADLGRDSHLGRQALEVVGSRPDPPPRAEVRGPIGWTLAGSAATAIAGVGVVVAVVTGSIAPAPAAAFLVLLLGLVGWRSNLLARGMTGGLRHTYAWWGGPAWRRFPISLTARPGGRGTRFVRAVRLDPDDDDFRLVGHLTPLPGTFRSVSAGGYYDPEHPYLVSVGTPVDTTDGVRIRAEDRTLIPPEPVPRLHALVPDPVDGPATPLLPADRSRYLRFAEALTQGGTPAVVILPPLPQAAFTRALDLILNWNIGDRDHISGRRMLALQRALRGIVEEAGGTVEALCDVILYLPTESEDSR